MTAIGTRNKRILLVEDEPDISRMLSHKLQRAGFQVDQAEDGVAALKLIPEKNPDLIILDLYLPRLSGEEVCKTLREDNRYCDFQKIPILMLTGKTSDADRIVGRSIGANSYLTKPFKTEEVIRQIKRLLVAPSIRFKEEVHYAPREIRTFLLCQDPHKTVYLKTALLRDKELRSSTPCFKITPFADPSHCGEALEHQDPDILLYYTSIDDVSFKNNFNAIRMHALGCPIIVITDRENEEFEYSMLKEGAQDCISMDKIHPRMFSRIIRYAIERKSMEQQVYHLNESLQKEIKKHSQISQERLEALNVTQKEVHQQSSILQSIVKNVAEGIIVADEKGKFLFWNAEAERIVGLGMMDIPVEKWSDTYGVFYPDMKTKYQTDQLPLVKAIKGEATKDIELFIKNDKLKEGAFVSVSGTPLRDDHHQIKGGVVVFRDITNKKKAEMKLRDMNVVLENAVEGVSELDCHGRYIKVNEAFAHMVGYTTQEMIGMHWVPTIYSRDRKKAEKGYAQMLHNGKSEYEIRGVRKDGSMFYKQVIMIRKGDTLANFKGHYCFVRDITHKKSVEYRQALDQRAQFLSTVSHELRTPMHCIEEGIRNVRQGELGEINEEQAEFLEISLRNVRRLSRLINNVLDFQKIDAGVENYKKIHVNINELIYEDIVAATEPLLKQKNLSLRLNFDQELPEIVCDRDGVTQVLFNLLNNAISFTEKGEIQITTKREGNVVKVSVHDDGPGIAAHDRDKLFQAFVQLDNRKKSTARGTGLGLAISKRLITRMGGKIWIENKSKGGATFSFALPIKERRHGREE